jgi:bifunctional non-homologous end joining protein LigD
LLFCLASRFPWVITIEKNIEKNKVPPGGVMPVSDKIAVQVDGRELTLTNLAKVLYQADGFTKAEVLDYYQRISGVLLPHIAGRPMTLKRYPDGVDGQSFFAKHAASGRPGWVRIEEIVPRSSRSRSPGEPIEYVLIDDLPTLMWAANLAALELHVPMWRFPDHRAREGAGAGEPAPEHGLAPDLLVFDLDPGPPATIVDCCRVAQALRPVLADADLDALPKTSGGKGLQLYASITGRGMTAEQASALAKGFAERLEGELPRLVVSRMTKSLRPGKVLIDWSQNNGSKTTVAPYSLRAREHPTVSTPVTWDEVNDCRVPRDMFFTAPDVLNRVEACGDLFAPLSAA